MIDALSSNNTWEIQDPEIKLLALSDKIVFNAKVDVGGYLASTLESDDLELAQSAYDLLEQRDTYSIEDAINFINDEVGLVGVGVFEVGFS